MSGVYDVIPLVVCKFTRIKWFLPAIDIVKITVPTSWMCLLYVDAQRMTS